jgi:hypothetical protein
MKQSEQLYHVEGKLGNGWRLLLHGLPHCKESAETSIRFMMAIGGSTRDDFRLVPIPPKEKKKRKKRKG